jgi:PAT family beta-lactamase induction signal transducer AmpG
MAALVLIGIVTVLVASEPEKSAIAQSERASEPSPLDDPRLAAALRKAFSLPVLVWFRPALMRLLDTRIGASAYHAFADFLTRDMAFVVLAFVILYKLCDAFAGVLTAPFVIDLGFSRNEYAAIVKGVGLAAALIGGFAGGALAHAYPLVTALWLGAFLQMASNFIFTWQALVGVNLWALTLTIIVENFTGAIGTVIFVAYLSALCQSPLHTATQYALLTALSAVGRTYLSAVAGFIAEWTGWPMFFILSAATALPSIALLAWLQQRGHFATLAKPTRFDADD